MIENLDDNLGDKKREITLSREDEQEGRALNHGRIIFRQKQEERGREREIGYDVISLEEGDDERSRSPSMTLLDLSLSLSGWMDGWMEIRREEKSRRPF